MDHLKKHLLPGSAISISIVLGGEPAVRSLSAALERQAQPLALHLRSALLSADAGDEGELPAIQTPCLTCRVVQMRPGAMKTVAIAAGASRRLQCHDLTVTLHEGHFSGRALR